MMPLDQYPFSERYGWIQDRYGLSWQIMYYGDRPIKQKITPVVMFTGEVAGKAEEALHFYTSIFKNSSIGDITRYGKGTVAIFNDGGRQIQEVALKGKDVSNITFGGNDGRTCFVTLQDRKCIEKFRSDIGGR